MKNLPDTVIVSPIRVTFAVALVVDWAAPSPQATQHILHQLEEQTVASEAQLNRVRCKLQKIKEALKKYTKSEKDYSPQSIERRLQWHFYREAAGQGGRAALRLQRLRRLGHGYGVQRHGLRRGQRHVVAG